MLLAVSGRMDDPRGVTKECTSPSRRDEDEAVRVTERRGGRSRWLLSVALVVWAFRQPWAVVPSASCSSVSIVVVDPVNVIE